MYLHEYFMENGQLKYKKVSCQETKLFYVCKGLKRVNSEKVSKQDFINGMSIQGVVLLLKERNDCRAYDYFLKDLERRLRAYNNLASGVEAQLKSIKASANYKRLERMKNKGLEVTQVISV